MLEKTGVVVFLASQGGGKGRRGGCTCESERETATAPDHHNDLAVKVMAMAMIAMFSGAL